MAEVGFYHLTRTGAEAALPRLLDRTLAAGQRALVVCADAARVAALDAVIWQAPPPMFLPHGSLEDGDEAMQPILLTERETRPDPPANGARFLFLLDGVALDRLDGFDRIFDLFDGRDPAAVAAARDRWRAAKSAGHRLTYWQQGPSGWTSRQS